MSSVFVSRVRDSFGETLERLGMEEEAGAPTPEELGRRAALLVGAEPAWDHHIGPMLTAAQAADLLGVGTRQAVHDRAWRGGLLALHRGSRQVRFPSFQLVERPGSTTRAVLPELGRVMRIFADAGVDEWTVASCLGDPGAAARGDDACGVAGGGQGPRTRRRGSQAQRRSSRPAKRLGTAYPP